MFPELRLSPEKSPSILLSICDLMRLDLKLKPVPYTGTGFSRGSTLIGLNRPSRDNAGFTRQRLSSCGSKAPFRKSPDRIPTTTGSLSRGHLPYSSLSSPYIDLSLLSLTTARPLVNQLYPSRLYSRSGSNNLVTYQPSPNRLSPGCQKPSTTASTTFTGSFTTITGLPVCCCNLSA